MIESEIGAIEANLFPDVRDLVRGDLQFPWHRDGRKVVTASQVVSSQALAIDLFGTIRKLQSRDDIFSAWIQHLGLTFVGPWAVELEALVPKAMLGEPRSTQIDVLARGCTGLIAFECKFTEPDGGACSQPTPIAKGGNAGKRQCDGRYVEQENPVNGVRSRCALTGKGIRYWSLVPEVMNIDPLEDHTPCPFSGGWYQWMRNLVAAAALGRGAGVPSAFVVVYADGPFPMAQKIKAPAWADLALAVEGGAVPLRAASYQELLRLAREAASNNDAQTLDDLTQWIERKLILAARRAAEVK